MRKPRCTLVLYIDNEMKKIVLYPFMALVLSVVLAACSVVPLTGRRQLNLVSEQEILASSLVQYRAFMRKAPISRNAQNTRRVVNVGQRIAQATMQYLQLNGLTDRAKSLAWEFNLVESNQINAFCMPGGKIVVYTGLLKIVGSDEELAAVMAHEVAHAVARHSNERISNELLRQMGSQVLTRAVLGHTSSIGLARVINQAYGLGSKVLVSLPYSRKHEYEADRIGMIFMAMAGYNPEGAISLWRRMSSGKAEKSDVLSTHPTDQKRVSALMEYLDQARLVYQGKVDVRNLNIISPDKKGTSSKTTNVQTNVRTSEKWHF